MREDEVRRRLGSRLRAEVSDDLWDLLKDLELATDAQLTGDLDELVGKACWILRVGSAPKRVEPMLAGSAEETAPDLARARLLSRLVAKHAESDEEVRAFRARHLPDGLVRWASFDEWLREHLASHDSHTRYITAPLPPEADIVREGRRDRLVPPLDELHGFGIQVRLLDYALPDDTWTRHVAVAVGSVPDQLRELAESLSSAFAWRPQQATIFVVCGVVPLIAPVRVSTTRNKTRNRRGVPWARRIKLDIDPEATPEEVVRAFRKARSDMRLPRQRNLSAKHLRLAVFAGIDHEGRSWRDRHLLWNDQFPHWAYTQQSNFRRDALRARDRVLGFTQSS